MAQGTVTVFEKFYESLVNGEHDIGGDTIKMMIITTLPVAGAAAIDKTDFTEVTAGGNYSAGGTTATVTVTLTAGNAVVDITNNPSWAQDGSNPTDAVALVVYNDTHASKECIAVMDLTTDGGSTPIDMSTDNLNVTINTSGLFDVGA